MILNLANGIRPSSSVGSFLLSIFLLPIIIIDTVAISLVSPLLIVAWKV